MSTHFIPLPKLELASGLLLQGSCHPFLDTMFLKSLGVSAFHLVECKPYVVLPMLWLHDVVRALWVSHAGAA